MQVVRLPAATLPAERRQLVFQWELHDGELVARGDGAARVAPPDSVRLDFFLGGGMGSGAAILIGDSLQVPGPEAARRLVPPPPLLWAALGRLHVPPERDTLARVDGPLLRADIGSPARWRLAFRGDTLVRLERVESGRIQEWVERDAGGQVTYRNPTARRSLTLAPQRSDPVSAFDPSIWHLR